jgi:hypothetical protein
MNRDGQAVEYTFELWQMDRQESSVSADCTKDRAARPRPIIRLDVATGDGPLSVRARPSSIKRDCDRRATSTGEKRLVNVHAKSRLTPEPLRTLRSETKGQAGACPDRTRAIPCKVRAVTGKVPMIEDPSRPKTVAKTVAMTADNTCSVRTTLECRPSTETAMDVPGRCAHSYGSEGWGFESLRARPAQRPIAIL